MPQLRLLAGEAVDQQIDGVSSQQRRHHLGRQVRAVVGVAGGVHDQRQRSEQEVNQLRRVRVVDVRLQLRLGGGRGEGVSQSCLGVVKERGGLGANEMGWLRRMGIG